MATFTGAKAFLLCAFAAVAGCDAQKPADTTPAQDTIFKGQFSFQDEGKTMTLKDASHQVVFDFDANVMTVTNRTTGAAYSKSTNGPLTTNEESLARFSESIVCFNMNKEANEKIIQDPAVESMSHGRGCVANGGIGRVNYKSTL